MRIEGTSMGVVTVRVALSFFALAVCADSTAAREAEMVITVLSAFGETAGERKLGILT